MQSRLHSKPGPNLLLAEFLCRWESGIAYAADPDEVESVAWMTPEEVQDHPKSPPWTVATRAAMEAKRIELGW